MVITDRLGKLQAQVESVTAVVGPTVEQLESCMRYLEFALARALSPSQELPPERDFQTGNTLDGNTDSAATRCTESSGTRSMGPKTQENSAPAHCPDQLHQRPSHSNHTMSRLCNARHADFICGRRRRTTVAWRLQRHARVQYPRHAPRRSQCTPGPTSRYVRMGRTQGQHLRDQQEEQPTDLSSVRQCRTLRCCASAWWTTCADPPTSGARR